MWLTLLLLFATAQEIPAPATELDDAIPLVEPAPPATEPAEPPIEPASIPIEPQPEVEVEPTMEPPAEPAPPLAELPHPALEPSVEPAHEPTLAHDPSHVEPSTPEDPSPAAGPTPVTPSAEPLLPFPFDFGWSVPTTSTPASTPSIPVSNQAAAPTNPWLDYLLPVPSRGPNTVIRLLFWLMICGIASRQLTRIKAKLLPRGLLPTAAALTLQMLRLIAILLAILVLMAILPEALLPIVPIAMLGAALAVGMSVWTVLPDLWAGVLIAVEQRIAVGQWLQTGEISGEVQWMGLRSTELKDREGRTIIVPNHVLMHNAIASDVTHWPPVDIVVPVPEELSTEQVRELLLEAVLLSPFLAPKEEPTLVQAELQPPIWRVRARIVEAHWADEFEGALRERVRELLERR